MQVRPKISLQRELGTLFWLQWKLTLAMFRSTRLSVRLRFAGKLLELLTFVSTFPIFTLMGVCVALLLALLSPQAAYEAAMLLNSFMFFVWLLLPASYNSQLIERFEMSRLFPHPISFRGVVVGSTLMSVLTITGIWTVPLLLGEFFGLAWHNPLAMPFIFLGGVPAFALLVLAGRIMDDLFDLVASDRRLRALLLLLLTLPLLFVLVGQQYIVQVATGNFEQVIPDVVLVELKNLDDAESLGEFWQALNNVFELSRPSRWLIWLPPGWVTAGMGLWATRNWGRALLFLVFSIWIVLFLLWGHAHITWRLMNGAAMSIGTERVSSRRGGVHLPGPVPFWALFHKDWLYLKRSPLPRQLFLPTLILVSTSFFILRVLVQTDAMSAKVAAAMPFVMICFTISMISMAFNMTLAANYFGAVDRQGFVSLATSPVDRRYILLSANLATLLYAALQSLVISIGVAFATGAWYLLPIGLYLGLCLQIGSSPAYNFSAIIGPYRAQFQLGTNQRQGNLWGMLAWLISAAPVLLLIVLPYFLWKPGLVLTLPLGLVGCAGFYALTLKPLARLLHYRENTVLDVVASDE